MATFQCLTHLLIVLLWVNGIVALVDDDDNTGDANTPAYKPIGIGDTLLDDVTKPDNKPGTEDQQSENQAAENSPKPVGDQNEEGGFGNENLERGEEGTENVDLAAAGIKHRFLESEEVEEEEKANVKPPDNTDSKTSPAAQNQASQQQQQPFAYFNQEQYVTNQVNLIFNNDPNNIPSIISYAHQGDIEHELLVFKVLKNLLKDLKNIEITGKIAVIQDLERHVLMMPGLMPNQRSDAEILKRQFYKMVYEQMTEEIKNAIVNRIPLNTPRYVLNSKTVLEHNEEFSRKILERSIRELYNETAERVRDLIDGMNTLPYITQSIHGFRAIFNQFDTKNEWNTKYKDVFLLAKVLQSKETMPNFYGISVAARNSFYFMKENLPYSVRNLIWSRNRVCFKNLDTLKYLYPANMTNVALSPVISTMNSLFLIRPLPQEGVWNLKENKESFQIINLYYQKSISGEKDDENGEDRDSAKEYPNKYEIIPQNDAVLIKNLKTNKYLKEVGVNVPPINKVQPVNSEEINDKFLWIVEDCGYYQMGPGSYYGMIPYDYGDAYLYK